MTIVDERPTLLCAYCNCTVEPNGPVREPGAKCLDEWCACHEYTDPTPRRYPESGEDR